MSGADALLVDPLEPAERWIVVRTKTLRERVAADHLLQRGVEPYVPRLLEPRWHRRAPRGPVPLFPGYLFARCNPAEQLEAVRYCPGVIRPVYFGKLLAAVGEGLIESLRGLEGERGFIVPAEVLQKPRPGQRVRIVSGPLKGLEGVFEKPLRGGERAMVLLQFLRSARSVEVDMLVLRPASA